MTGCAGFIGSNLVDRLLRDGHEVIGYDNLSTGQVEFLEEAFRSSPFTLVRGDTLDLDAVTRAMRGAEFVFHLAANADVRYGTEHPRLDLDQNTIATFNVLEAMRAHGIRRIAFSSTGSIYGEPEVFPTPEDAPFPIQTSLYGASKLAGGRVDPGVLRGVRLPGLHLSLRVDPGRALHAWPRVRLLPPAARGPDDASGPGQRETAQVLPLRPGLPRRHAAARSTRAHEKVNVFNLGTDEYCQVDDSIGWIAEHLGASPERVYTGGERGWIGDSPFIFLDCSRIRALGWKPALSIREGIIRTLRYLEQNSWLFERRR